MLKIHVPEPIAGIRVLPFLGAGPAFDQRLFQAQPQEEYAGIFDTVTDPQEADIVVAPHDYDILKSNPERFEEYRRIAREAGKKLLVSAMQDDPSPIDLPDAVILRPSAYRSTLLPNEIITPAYIEDVGRTYGSEPMGKADRASVGFVGKAGFANIKERVRYAARNYLLRHGPDREGLYFRRHALASLARSQSIDLNTVVRTSFSANRKTIEVSPEEARRDYIRSLKDSLITLAPRGDGNYSLRFFETLSMGRLPLLIDTDSPLPLADGVPYDEFVIRVPWQEVDRAGEHVASFFASKSDAELQSMQRRARDAFENYLYMPRFLRIILTPEYLAPYL